MRVSNAITLTQKASIIEAASEKLRLLAKHPLLKELIKEMHLSSIEDERPSRFGLLGTVKRWSETSSILKLTPKGVVESIAQHKNYKIKSKGDHPLFLAFPARIGGIIEFSEKPIAESEFPDLSEKYDLDPDVLQKVIDHLNQ